MPLSHSIGEEILLIVRIQLKTNRMQLKMSQKDVIKCAQSIELDTIYFLTGKEFYEENLLSNN